MHRNQGTLDSNHKGTSGVIKLMLSIGFLLAGSFRWTGLTSNDRTQIIQGGPFLPIITSTPAHAAKNMTRLKTSNFGANFSPFQQKAFLSSFGSQCTPYLDTKYSSSNPILDVYNMLDSDSATIKNRNRAQEIQQDLWKFCALGVGYASAYIDFDQVYVTPTKDEWKMRDILRDASTNYAAVNEFQTAEKKDSIRVIHSAVIRLGHTESGRKVARDMTHLLLNTNIDTLLSENNYAMWKGMELYRLVDEAWKRNSDEWTLFRNHCVGLHTIGIGNGHQYHHSQAGFCSRTGEAPCCQVEYDSSSSTKGKFFLTRHGLEVYGTNDYLEQSFVSQVVESKAVAVEQPFPFEINGRPLAPRLFNILLENDCLPSHACHRCLSRQSGGDQTSQCEACHEECSCYCEALCKKIKPHQMKVTKECHVNIPSVRKHADRLIPKVVHQTYFEPVTQEKYPNFSRLVESWKLSGWDYKFYLDEDAEGFISTYFPPEVREAYDLLIPGAYKADLFRYCVLLIHGGIYADVDVLLSSDLDKLLEGDIGFMVPVDEPGRSTGAGSCLWNGFLAAAPGHPVVAKTIEMVVNNIRNRYTAVDIDNMLCPTRAHHRLPDLDLSHSFDLLYITGPCMLGGALNTVLGKHIQSHIAPGELNTLNTMKQVATELPSDESHFIQGRTIILGQNKNDMGSHRFTFLENNLIVATTDMPGYDDRKGAKHYSDSKNEKRHILFGMKGIFKNLSPANEWIRIFVNK